MRNKAALLAAIFLGFSASVAAAGSVDSAAGDGSNVQPPPPLIAIKQTTSTPIVYVEHTGAYWTIGDPLAEIRQYMIEHDEPGPWFIRFLDHPHKVPPDSLRSWVGVISSTPPESSSPYVTGALPSELVVYLRVGKSAVADRRQLSAMTKWALRRGYIAIGPVTQIFSLPDIENASERQAELQLVVRPSDEPTSHANRRSSPVDHGRRPVSVPPQPRTAASKPVATMTEPPDAAPIEPGRMTKPAPSRTGTNAPVTRPVTPAHQTSLNDLADAGRYSELAERLLPHSAAIAPAQQVWVGRFVHRVAAAGRGIKKLYPGKEHAAVILAEALVQRFEEISKGFTVDPLDDWADVARAAQDPQAAAWQDLLREVDGLLGAVAYRSLNPDEIQSRLLQAVQRAHELLQTDKAEDAGGTPAD